jgi:hypothetical protein
VISTEVDDFVSLSFVSAENLTLFTGFRGASESLETDPPTPSIFLRFESDTQLLSYKEGTHLPDSTDVIVIVIVSDDDCLSDTKH